MTGIGAGRLDKLVTFLGRPAFDPTTTARAGYVPIGQAWAYFKPGNAVRMLFGTFKVYVPSGALTVRSETLTRTITAANQVLIDGQGFQVRSSPPGDRRTGDIVLDIVGVQDAAAYAREIDTNGEVVTIQRNRSGQPALKVQARAKVDGYQPSELTDDIQQGDVHVMLLEADLAAAGFPEPVVTTDLIIVRGRELSVLASDDNTHRVGGQLLAYDIQARG